MVKMGIVRITSKPTWRFWISFPDNGPVALSKEYPNRAMALKAFRRYINQ